VLSQQVVVLGDVPVVEIRNAEIQKNIEKKGEVEYDGIKTVIGSADRILHGKVNPEDPEGLDQQVQEKEQSEVGQKFSLHGTPKRELGKRKWQKHQKKIRYLRKVKQFGQTPFKPGKCPG
jgi:hypothetical protein